MLHIRKVMDTTSQGKILYMLFYAHADDTHQSTHLGKRELVKASTAVLK